jgi:hypothetical protein
MTKHLTSDDWVPVGKYQLHECCGCGMEHRVEIRWNTAKARLEERWVLTKTPPRKQQKKP